MSENKNNKEEEVDLGSLFIIIGNGFRKFFNFIWKILSGIFHFIILILLFIKENVIKLGIATILGALLGGYLQYNSGPTYASDLLVEPNFESARQLYQNIDYYNELVSQEEYKKLSEVFGIDSLAASTMKSFEVEPIKTSNDILESYDKLVLSVDTTTVKNYTYLDFKKAFTIHDYKVHKVHVEATDNKVFKKLSPVIIGSITDNKYFNRIRNLTVEDLYRTDSILKENLVQVDSLRKVYMTVLLEEAKKESTGTTIDMGSQKRGTKEIELFQTNRTIYYELKKITNDISEQSDIVNVISDFQPVGYKIRELNRNKIVVFAGLAFLLVSAFVLLLKLNVYLENYKKG